jgi:hypothetical protein
VNTTINITGFSVLVQYDWTYPMVLHADSYQLLTHDRFGCAAGCEAAGAPEEQDVYSSSGLLTVGAPAERDVLVSQAVSSRS